MNAAPLSPEHAPQSSAAAWSADANDFDALTRLAAQFCDAPIASISLLRTDRVWFLAAQGLQVASVDARVAFAPHVSGAPNATLIVPDAVADPRFAGHPLVTQAPRIRFYAGSSIVTANEQPFGCLSVMDCVPRSISAEQANALRVLARQIAAQLMLRRLQSDLAQAAAARNDLQEKVTSYQTRLDTALVRLNTGNTIDAPTGLLNRRAFEARLDTHIG